ncbi:MAG: Holliday junction branch migration DNA helicase RuvB, partial [Treponema sp.]|nr:Holliday junction branch migration DNA helicase RuvB [Treponema sp.]
MAKIDAPRKTPFAGIVHPEKTAGEDEKDLSLRPKNLAEFLGQAAIKQNLAVFIEAARARNESLDHLFLIGPPGLGKTTLAQVVAHELGAEFKVTSAPALDKPKDLAGILTTVTAKTVFFIDEIHRLKPAIEEMLYIAMEDYEMDWIIGQGPSARTIRIPIQPFTLVGATTKAGNVSSPLVSRFGITCRFSFYEQADMEAIVRRSAGILKVGINEDAASLLAASSRGTPRVVNRLLRRMRDFAQVAGAGRITAG